MLLASQDIHKQYQHFDWGQDDLKIDMLLQHDLAASRNAQSDNEEPYQNDDIDEARYNLATRVMSNGVEVIIAGDKTKTTDHIVPDISNGQLQYNKPMTLAASTIKNQMMIHLLPSTSTATDSNFVGDQLIPETPDLSIGIFPTTYSYFNAFRDNSDKVHVLKSEYTVVNTITGPNDYVAYLQTTIKATPALKTNTYYSEFTFSQNIKSKMHTFKTNLTQVVVTKSYTPDHSTSVLTSYYAYENGSLDDTDGKINLFTTSLFLNKVEKLNDDGLKLMNGIHIYTTKTFLTTFTYYTTTVLNSYIQDISKTELGINPVSTVFNYYTRVIENVITDSIPATMLPNELLTKMKMELKKQKPHQRRRLIVTTATFKDGQTVKISAVEMYKENTAPVSFNKFSLSSINLLPQVEEEMGVIEAGEQDGEGEVSVAVETDFHQTQTNKEDNKTIDGFQSAESANLLGTLTPLDIVKLSQNQTLSELGEEEDNNGFASLPSEHILSVTDAPNKQTANTNASAVINDKPTTSAANHLIQRLTALKPMLNAMADLFQNNFGVTREIVKPIKNIESKHVSNKSINSTDENTTLDVMHPIYIPVPKSPMKIIPEQILNYTEFIPQSLHIKPPLLVGDDKIFEINNKEITLKDKHTNIIPLSTLGASRQEQPLHNGGIYIRPGEIITANSDVIVGRPNGIEYVEVPTELNIYKNISNTNSLDNRQFQVTYYHNKIQHPYKKKSSSDLTLNTQKPQLIPIMNNVLNNNKLSLQPTSGLRPPNEKHFNKNILKPPPPPAIQSTIPIRTHQGLLLTLKAPEKLIRNRIKKQPLNSTKLSVESTHAPLSPSPLHLHSPSLLAPSMYKISGFLPPTASIVRETQNFYNFNGELKSNDILEIQRVPQIFSADLKPNSIQNSKLNVTKLSNNNLNDNMQTTHAHTLNPQKKQNTNFEGNGNSLNWQNAKVPSPSQTLPTYSQLQPAPNIVHAEKNTVSSEYFPYAGREQQIKTPTPAPYVHIKDQKSNSSTLDNKFLKGNLKYGRQPQPQLQISKLFSSHVADENRKPLHKSKFSVLPTNHRWKTSSAFESPTKLADADMFFQSLPLISTAKFSHNLSSNSDKNSAKLNSKQNINYSNDSMSKNHQNVSLDQHIFSHTVDVHVPPLTFNRDDQDYLQQTATAVKGQIPSATVTEMKTKVDNSYNYMPLITIPVNEQHVQVNLTPFNSINTLALPHDSQNAFSWKTETANNNNNIVRKIALINANFKVITNDGDQKTFATNDFVNIRPIPEAHTSWKQYRRQQPHTYNSQHSNNKPKISTTNESTTKPAILHVVRQKSDTNHNFPTTSKPNRKHQESKVSSSNSYVQIHLHPNELQTVEHHDTNFTPWLIPADHIREIGNQQNHSKEQNRLTIFSSQKTMSTATSKSATTEPTRPEDINQILTSNIKNEKTIQVTLTPLITHGQPFIKANYNHKEQNKDIFTVKNKNKSETDAIFTVPGEAFKASTNKHDLNPIIANSEPKQDFKTNIPTTEQIFFTKELFGTRETQYTRKPITSPTAITKNPKLSKLKINNATTITSKFSSSFSLSTPATIAKNVSKNVLTSYSFEKSYKANTGKYKPNKENQVTLHRYGTITSNTTKELKIDVGKQSSVQQPSHTNIYNQNATTISSQNNIKVDELQNDDIPTTNKILMNLENESRKSNESCKLFDLQPSESFEAKLSTTKILTSASSILTYTTTTTTTTIKRIILPTKYITNKLAYTVTTVASAPPQKNIPPPLPISSLTTNSQPSIAVTTFFLTHTKTNTIVDTVTSVKTLDPVTIIATTTLKPSTTDIPLIDISIINANFTESLTREISPHTTAPHLAHLPQPSVEVVLNNITLNSDLQPNENSIFIIMTNNKSKKNTIFSHPISSQVDKNSQESEVNNNVEQIDETNEVMIEYDNGISFDDIPIRDEESKQIVNDKSVSSPVFVNNAASVKENFSDDHVILGGVLIATPPKFPSKQLNLSETSSMGCHPKCRVSRNEQCSLIENQWVCVCRPGFARMFPDRPCKPTYTYKLLILGERIGNYPLQYMNELKNNKTNHYKQLSKLVNNALDRMVMQSDFRDAYHGVEVMQYSDGHKNHGILIDVLIQLSDNSNEKRLEEVFKKNLRLSNYSIGGTDVYTNRAGVDALAIKDFNECMSRKLHDCSENAHCFNLPGTYTCSCMEGFEDLTDNPIYPGRTCSSEEIGCDTCYYHGKCSSLIKNLNDSNYCECFPWYAGSRCQVNLKILLIVLLGIGTLLFILLLFCMLITCTKRNNYVQHTTLAPSTVSSNSEGLQKNSQLAANMVITNIDMRGSSQDVSLKNNRRQKSIKIDKRSVIKDSSSETSQHSLSFVLKNKETIAGTWNKKKTWLLKHSKPYRHCGFQGGTTEQYSASVLSSIPLENKIDFNAGITVPSSFEGNNKQTEQQNLLANSTEYEGHYCEQSDRSLTVMIPRAKYHSSVMSQPQLMHHQLTMERVHKTTKHENKLTDADAEVDKYYKKNWSNIYAAREISDDGKRTKISTNPGALISAGFEVSAIVKDNTIVVNSAEHHNDLFSFDSMPKDYTLVITSDPASSLDSNSDQNHLLTEDRQQIFTSNKKFSTNESEYNAYKCEKDLIETMDEWLGNVKLNEISAEARSFDETTIRASTKPLSSSTGKIRTQQDLNAGTQTQDEKNTMAERDVGSTFLLPHTHLYKPERVNL